MESVIRFNMKKILIIDCGSSKVPEIENFLSVNNFIFSTVKLDQLTTINTFSHIIISGAPILLTKIDQNIYLQKAAIIFSDKKIPVLGICFGHQLMGLFHKAKISMCNESRTWENIQLVTTFDLLPNCQESVLMFEDHCECITLPSGFKLVASSLTCVNEAMKHEVYPWYGVQFHPEVSESQGQELMLNFINLTNNVNEIA